MLILAIAVIGGFALYVMSPSERERLLGRGIGVVALVQRVLFPRGPARDPFHEALYARTRWPVITAAIVASNVVLFVLMIFGPGASDAETLLKWGASFGPRTTNGEWWRIVTATFVQPGFIPLLFTIAGLAQIGSILERVVGPIAFSIVYVSAGVFAGILNLALRPIDVHAGAAPAVFALYGLLLVVSVRGLLRRTPLTIPLRVYRHLAPAAALFLLYQAASGIRTAEIAGLVVGLVYGVILTHRIERAKPGLRLMAPPVAATLVIGLAASVALRGVTDVRPELERLTATEERIATLYERAVGQFRIGAMSAKALAQVIDRSIVPELRAARARLDTIRGIPRQHQPLMASAEEYLRLRDESWRIRSQALHAASMGALRDADRVERDSLEALQKVRSAPLQ